MLYLHLEQNTQAIFRLKKRITPIIDNFINGKERDCVIEYIPSKKQQTEIQTAYPQMSIKPLKLRLVKYHFADTAYYLETTLLDGQRYPASEFPDLYP